MIEVIHYGERYGSVDGTVLIDSYGKYYTGIYPLKATGRDYAPFLNHYPIKIGEDCFCLTVSNFCSSVKFKEGMDPELFIPVRLCKLLSTHSSVKSFEGILLDPFIKTSYFRGTHILIGTYESFPEINILGTNVTIYCKSESSYLTSGGTFGENIINGYFSKGIPFSNREMFFVNSRKYHCMDNLKKHKGYNTFCVSDFHLLFGSYSEEEYLKWVKIIFDYMELDYETQRYTGLGERSVNLLDKGDGIQIHFDSSLLSDGEMYFLLILLRLPWLKEWEYVPIKMINSSQDFFTAFKEACNIVVSSDSFHNWGPIKFPFPEDLESHDWREYLKKWEFGGDYPKFHNILDLCIH